MMRSLAAAALLAANCPCTGPAFAVQDPRAGRWDARVRTVALQPDESGTPGGKHLHVHADHLRRGRDGDARRHWRLPKPGLAQPTGNLLFIKPIEVRAPTNMQVVTSRPDGSIRSYQFELLARAATSPTGSHKSPALARTAARPGRAR